VTCLALSLAEAIADELMFGATFTQKQTVAALQ
jgi:hypothetical protein